MNQKWATHDTFDDIVSDRFKDCSNVSGELPHNQETVTQPHPALLTPPSVDIKRQDL